MEAQELQELIARAQSSDREAFGLLFRYYYTRLLPEAELACPGQGEDLVQSVMLAAWSHIHDTAPDKFEGWLREMLKEFVAITVCVNKDQQEYLKKMTALHAHPS